MLSKGIDCYGFVQGANRKIVFSKPISEGDATYFAPPINEGGEIESVNIQLYTGDIGWSEKSGRFRCNAFEGATQLQSIYAEINPITGNMADSNLSNFLNCPSVFGSDFTITYGFYDSGPGKISDFYNQDQCYMYVTDPVNLWMTQLLKEYPDLKDAPFSIFALPGAHDAGMCTDVNAQRLVGSVEFQALVLVIAAALSLIDPLLGILAISSDVFFAQTTVNNLSITQKDSITDMLNLGVRYFDFRPGTVFGGVLEGIYHQHLFVPGYEYDAFITDVINWLEKGGNENEIVVVALANDGFLSDSMYVAFSKLLETITDALSKSKLQLGDTTDFSKKVGDIISANRRLILVSQLDDAKGTPYYAPKYDSYNENFYNTINPTDIVSALEGMQSYPPPAPAPQPPETKSYPFLYTVLQLQATSTGVSEGVLASLADFSDATSPLMGTKAKVDHKTYPWIKENAGKFSTDYPLVLLNDFADNALAVHAIKATQERIIRLQGKTSFNTWNQLGDIPNPRTIVSGGDTLYMLDYLKNMYSYSGSTWEEIDHNMSTQQIVCSGGTLFQLHNNGNIYKYNGGGITGWAMLGSSVPTSLIAADGINVYRLQTEGTDGVIVSMYLEDGSNSWQELYNINAIQGSSPISQIAASAGHLFLLDQKGRILQYTGMPLTGWQVIFNYLTWGNVQMNSSAPKNIVADGNDLYLLEEKGGIYKYSTAAPNWVLLDIESDAKEISTSNGQLYKLGSTGNVSKYIDSNISALAGWERLDFDNNSQQITSGHGTLFNINNSVSQIRYIGTVMQYSYSKWEEGDNQWQNWTKIGEGASTLANYGGTLCSLNLGKSSISQYTGGKWVEMGIGSESSPNLVMIGSENNLYQTIPSNSIYKYTGNDNAWEKIGGPGKKFVGIGNDFYGLAPDSTQVVKYGGTPNQWTKMGGPMLDIIGGGSALYGISPQNQNIMQYTGSGMEWTEIGGPGYMFVGVGDTVYGLYPDRSAIYQYQNIPGHWKKIGDAAEGIIGGGKALYAISPTNFDLWRFTNGIKWDRIGGPAYMYLPIGDDIYAISRDKSSIYKLNP